LAVKSGRAIRFNESTVRPMGRNAAGVKGVTLDETNDELIGMVCIQDQEKETVLVVSEKGYGKRTDIEDYRITNRGGKGVKTLQITDKTGNLVGIKSVVDGDELMIITKNGITIRMEVKDLRVMGRATQGVKLIKLSDEDEIASVAKIEESILASEINLTEDIVIPEATTEDGIQEVDGTSESKIESPESTSTDKTDEPTSPEEPTNPEEEN
jgi:DNA gyrase subunit A